MSGEIFSNLAAFLGQCCVAFIIFWFVYVRGYNQGFLHGFDRAKHLMRDVFLSTQETESESKEGPQS